jgi:protein-S-isoprenylcysteine O-methyltransferase Ste14
MCWPDESRATPWLGGALYVLGQSLLIAARRVNPYFSQNLQISPVVIQAGIYRYLRSPGYVGMLMSATGAWLYFASWPALVPGLAYAAIILFRVAREGAFLR